MDVDIEIPSPGMDVGEGCGGGLLAAFVGLAVVVALVGVMVEHWQVALTIALGVAVGCLGTAAFMDKHKRARPQLVVLALVLLLACVGMGAWAVDVEGQRAERERIVRELELEAQAAEFAREVERREEQRRTGAWGRFKRWAFGDAAAVGSR